MDDRLIIRCAEASSCASFLPDKYKLMRVKLLHAATDRLSSSL